MTFRVICAGVLLAAGIGLAIVSLIHGQPIIALALAMAAVYVCLGVVIGITDAIDSPMFKAAAAVIGLVGIIGVFAYSRGLSPQVSSAHASALNDFAYADLWCPHPSPKLLAIENLGIKACMKQSNSDQMASVIDLAKAIHYGPTLSLADSAASLGHSEAPDYCAVAFKAADALCPSAFSSLSKSDRETLTKLGSNL